MATPKVTFQTCCSNSLMFGLIWASFLPGNVVFIMAIHPVSIILYIWLYFYVKKVPFVIILTAPLKNHRNRPKLTIFFIFSPGWSMESVPVHCQIASYNSQTSEKYQLHRKPLFHGGVWSYFSSYRVLPQMDHILQFCSLRLHTDVRLLIGKWWPEPKITNMA